MKRKDLKVGMEVKIGSRKDLEKGYFGTLQTAYVIFTEPWEYNGCSLLHRDCMRVPTNKRGGVAVAVFSFEHWVPRVVQLSQILSAKEADSIIRRVRKERKERAEQKEQERRTIENKRSAVEKRINKLLGKKTLIFSAGNYRIDIDMDSMKEILDLAERKE